MGLLSQAPAPQLGWVYDMPGALYDSTDRGGHPVLVVSLDPDLGVAEVVTRTTKIHAKGRPFVAHPVQPDLGLRELGWWRVQWPHRVPFAHFADPEAQAVGPIDDMTWRRVQTALASPPGGPR